MHAGRSCRKKPRECPLDDRDEIIERSLCRSSVRVKRKEVTGINLIAAHFQGRFLRGKSSDRPRDGTAHSPCFEWGRAVFHHGKGCVPGIVEIDDVLNWAAATPPRKGCGYEHLRRVLREFAAWAPTRALQSPNERLKWFVAYEFVAFEQLRAPGIHCASR